MKRYTRRQFLRILPALPVLAIQFPGVMPTEPEEPKLNINERLLFLEKDNLWRDITVKYLEFNVRALLRCFRGCGNFNLPRRYRL